MRIQWRTPGPATVHTTTDIAELAHLNPAQREAMQHPLRAQALLVLAGAGSGKTLTIAARVAWLVQQGADPQRLLLITFSRRAAAEMAQRAGRLLHQAAGLSSATPPPQLPWCGTFHSVAARLLRDEAPRIGLAPGFSVLDRADSQDLLALVRQQRGLADSSGRARFPLPATCLAIHSRCVNTRQPLAAVLQAQYPWCAAHAAELQALFAGFAQAKREQQSLDFDDLLLAWWHLLQEPAIAARLRARFDHVLVDELQDVNALQADIVHALRPGGQGLTAVGDDAQSIYGFRGAEVRHILGLPQRCEPPARVLALQQNYRSTPAILAAANAVIGLAEEGYPKALWSQRGDGPLPRLVAVLDEAAQARGVADAVLARREQGTLLRRQAVLFRTATHSAALELELVRRGIPFVKYGGLRFLEAAHIKDMLALLRWADNPASRLATLRSARLVPGLGPASVARLLAAGSSGSTAAAFVPPRAAAAGWASLMDLMARLRGPAARWPQDLQAVIDWYQPQLERLHDDARVRRADLDQLCQLAAGHGSRQQFVTELTLDPPAATSNEADVPHRDEDYLILSTIHSAKGQEWSVVHVLNVVDGCMPADMATGQRAEIEEERRLLYVAMTRARDALDLWLPQRFHVTQQRALGDRHLYGSLTRFIPAAIQQHFEATTVGLDAAPADEAGGDVPMRAAGAVNAVAASEPAPGFDLHARLLDPWR
jgi:DNA helicase-2/ATP-dependent DNA helicase PcrA